MTTLVAGGLASSLLVTQGYGGAVADDVPGSLEIDDFVAFGLTLTDQVVTGLAADDFALYDLAVSDEGY